MFQGDTRCTDLRVAMTLMVYRTNSISPPANYCFLVGAVTGRRFNIFLFLKGCCRAVVETIVFKQCERRVVRKPPQNSLDPQPQPRLHPLHSSGSSSEGGGGCSATLYTCFFRGAVAHFDHGIILFEGGRWIRGHTVL